MKRLVTLEEVDQSPIVTIYTLHFVHDEQSEFEKFLSKKPQDSRLLYGFNKIIALIERFKNEGINIRRLRPEGKYKDNVWAIGIDSGALRLYCIPLSEEILILGNGGIKRSRTVQDDPILTACMTDLMKFDKALKQKINRGTIIIAKNQLINIENINIAI